ncbi:hypothetical protein E2C01_039422 [Portunus trituberculatus]|uniref:Uncharacterized protein n=1 Tax=Portunus trituberculatus TaxID=210409 RepID=A0A5B7FJT8_PORTR|nr:hypothetical protein [Portunus trituberculatus]
MVWISTNVLHHYTRKDPRRKTGDDGKDAEEKKRESRGEGQSEGENACISITTFSTPTCLSVCMKRKRGDDGGSQIKEEEEQQE